MSFATIKTIAKAVAWGIKRNKHGIYNVCEKNTLGLTRGLFYEKIHELYGSRMTGGIVWDSKTEFDRDKLFCMDPDPFLPSSQRCNSQVSIAKIINEGF
jgi:isocitrate dehydrogenase